MYICLSTNVDHVAFPLALGNVDSQPREKQFDQAYFTRTYAKTPFSVVIVLNKHCF